MKGGTTAVSILCQLFLASQVFAAPAPREADHSTFDHIEEINRNVPELFEGDIVPNKVLEEMLRNSGSAKREATRRRKQLWRTRIVPYTFSSDFPSEAQDKVRGCMRTIEEKSCLTFKPHKDEPDWINFVRQNGCFSLVGRDYYTKGSQVISIGHGCLSNATILHEIMHALGFWHEQSRPDRDKYVEVFWENIMPGVEHNFEKKGPYDADQLDTLYDYDTIMHYGNYAFSANGKQTLKAIGSDQPLGEATTLTTRDIIALNTLYDCANYGKSIWSAWSSFSQCGKTCSKFRDRFCTHSDLSKCVSANKHGVQRERVVCTDAECHVPVDGHWSRWSSWTECNAKCGKGTKSRTRICDDPVPRNGGAACQGGETGFEECLIVRCNLGPLDCDFEDKNLCHWQKDPTSSRFKWKIIKGPTRSERTGPSGDHTTGGGYYLFWESSSPAITGDKGRLVSKLLDPTGPLCITLWYNMNGLYMGSLRIFKSVDGVNSLLFEKSGDQGQNWHKAELTVESRSKFKIIIEAERGTYYLSDIAIDDVSMKDCRPKSILEHKCGIKMKAIGCFNDPPGARIFTEILDNHRVYGGHKGFLIDWYNYPQSLTTILCHCAERTKAKGYKIFGLGYYSECWSGPNDVVYSKHGTSNRCVDVKYNACLIKDDALCSGSENNQMVYQLI